VQLIHRVLGNLCLDNTISLRHDAERVHVQNFIGYKVFRHWVEKGKGFRGEFRERVEYLPSRIPKFSYKRGTLSVVPCHAGIA